MEKIFFPTSSDSIGKEIECEQLVIDIHKQSLNPPRWPECCIYRVPNKLRKVKEEAYTPRLVSIGPFHHGQEQFRGMEIQKFRYLREFFNRTGKSYQDLSSIVEENEEQIRHCYSETIELGTTDFVNMVLLDSVFIMELFLRTYGRKNYEKDYIVGSPWFERHIKQDFLLLENQLPFNFLQKFYESAFNGNGEQDAVPSFLYLSWSYFLSNNNRPTEEERMRRILEVPKLVVDDQTEILFRNLMALEQCHYPFDTYICNYVVLLDYLITTKADVVFLVEKGIVVNRLGSSAAVTTLINKFGLEIVEVNSRYHDLIKDLNQYHENNWNRLMASLTSVYFRDFWRGSATFTGIFVLCVAFWNFLRPFVLDT
ncbi:hypothetical protein CJ030_MR0G026997 [Morella rubra]|uniref:Uncharacterized protein n=1 Tax=Morella rubra TaxID=262757 RepID=A0A6A1UF78_9ROSI|nr:hypothetical protein CJ030_MR0G026997 [Morella rubra]